MAKITVDVNLRGLQQLQATLRRLEGQIRRLNTIATGAGLLSVKGQTDINKGLESVGKSIDKNLSAPVQSSKRAIKELEDRLNNLKRAREGLVQGKLFNGERETGFKFLGADALDKEIKRTTNAIDLMKETLQATGQVGPDEFKDTADAIKDVGKGAKGADEGLFGMVNRLNEALASLPIVGRLFQGLGGEILSLISRFGIVTVLIGGVITAFGKLKEAITRPITNAVAFQAAFAEVRSILPDVERNAARAAKGIEKISESVVQSPEDLAKGFYQVISAGVTDTSEALEVLRVSANAATAGLTDSFTAVDAITTILNSYQLSVSDATKVSDLLFTTVREGKLVFKDLADNIGKVAPVAFAAGVSIEETLAAVATLTKGGLRPDIAITALRTALGSVIKPTAEAERTARQLGIEFNTAAIKSQGLVKWLAEVQEKTGGNERVVARLFGEVRGLTAVLALAGAQAEEFARISAQMGEAEGATADAVDEVNDKIESQWDLLKSRLSPLFNAIGDSIANNWNENLKETNRNLEVTERILKRIKDGDFTNWLKFGEEWDLRNLKNRGPYDSDSFWGALRNIAIGFKTLGSDSSREPLASAGTLLDIVDPGEQSLYTNIGKALIEAEKTALEKGLKDAAIDILDKEDDFPGFRKFVEGKFGLAFKDDLQFKQRFLALTGEEQGALRREFDATKVSKAASSKLLPIPTDILNPLAADELDAKILGEAVGNTFKKLLEQLERDFQLADPVDIKTLLDPTGKFNLTRGERRGLKDEQAERAERFKILRERIDRVSSALSVFENSMRDFAAAIGAGTRELKDLPNALRQSIGGSGAKLLGETLGDVLKPVKNSITKNLIGEFIDDDTFKKGKLGLGPIGAGFLTSGLLLGAGALLGGLFGNDEEEKQLRELEKISRNTDRQNSLLQQLIGAPGDFFSPNVGSPAYAGISRATFNDLGRG